MIEMGSECAEVLHPRAFSLYQIDCFECTTEPSLPFRRVASTAIRIRVSNSSVHLWAYEDARLSQIPGLAGEVEATLVALFKLALMLLAAAVIWIRAAKATSKHHLLFLHCLSPASAATDSATEFQDALIGLLAIGARVGVSWYFFEELAEDGQQRLALIQILASALSVAHWLARYFVFESEESSLTKLGGSTAICDASSAVMIAFATPPLLRSSNGIFDATARLLTAILISLVAMQRCLYSAACCGTLFALTSASNPGYRGLLTASGLLWVAQASALAALLADAFCTPIGFSSSRSLAGDRTPISMGFFFAVSAASLPQLMKSVEKVAEHTRREQGA